MFKHQRSDDDDDDDDHDLSRVICTTERSGTPRSQRHTCALTTNAATLFVLLQTALILPLVTIIIAHPSFLLSAGINSSNAISVIPSSITSFVRGLSAESAKFDTGNVLYLSGGLHSAHIPDDAPIRFRHFIQNSGVAIDKTVILSFVSFGYMDFTLHWLCHLQRLNMSNWLLGALDNETEHRMIELGYGQHVFRLNWLFNNDTVEKCAGATTHGFHDPCFNVNTVLKLQILLVTALAGYDILYTDMDVTLIHNPFLYLPLAHYVEIQREPLDGFCTGFMYWKSNLFTVSLLQTAILHMDTHNANDQDAINAHFDANKYVSADTFDRHVFPLSRKLYPTGASFAWMSKTGVIQHNNWMLTANSKRRRFNESGLDIFDKKATARNVASGIKSSSGSFLTCRVCRVCDTIKPHLSPLRLHWPGPLVTSNFTEYRENIPIDPEFPNIVGAT